MASLLPHCAAIGALMNDCPSRTTWHIIIISSIVFHTSLFIAVEILLCERV